MKRAAQLCLHLPTELSGQPFLQLSAYGKESIEIEGIPPGSYEASVRIGEWYDKPLILGTVPVEVVAGQVTRVELQLAPPVESESVRMAGVLVLPEEWGINTFTIDAELDGTAADGSDGEHKATSSKMERSPNDPEEWHFDFGDVVSGDYNLEFATRYPRETTYGFLVTAELGTSD